MSENNIEREYLTIEAKPHIMVVREERIHIIRYTTCVLKLILESVPDNETCETGCNWLDT